MLTDKLKEIDEQNNGEISQAIKDQRFKPIIKNGVWIGFFCWWLQGRKVFVNNMYISPEHRDKSNLLWVRKQIREHYLKNYECVYWKNLKHNERIFETKEVL